MSRNKTEGRYGGSRYGRHWRTREHDLPGCPSYWHAMGAQTRRHRRRFKPGKVAIFAMEYQGVEYPMRQIDENTWEPVGLPCPIPRGEVLRIIPAACKQLASAGGDARPVDCAGDPQCCPQNEGYGCHCSAAAAKDKP